MALIYYLPDEIEIEANEGETILLAALRAGIAHACLCGGNARCSSCRVIIIEGLENCARPNPEEQAIAEMLRLEPQVRMACQTVVTGKVKLRRLVTDIHEDVDLTIAVEKYILIFFSDIRGFTSFAESLLPYDVIHVLNLYFQKVGEVIARHGGVIQFYG